MFAATEPGTGTETWVSDGTTAGTVQVGDVEVSDWEGEISTEHFVLHEAETHWLIAREYEHALVVVKLMARDQLPGTDPTTYTLPDEYQRVRPDLSLEDVSTSVTLFNNDAAILMKP